MKRTQWQKIIKKITPWILFNKLTFSDICQGCKLISCIKFHFPLCSVTSTDDREITVCEFDYVAITSPMFPQKHEANMVAEPVCSKVFMHVCQQANYTSPSLHPIPHPSPFSGEISFRAKPLIGLFRTLQGTQLQNLEYKRDQGSMLPFLCHNIVTCTSMCVIVFSVYFARWNSPSNLPGKPLQLICIVV